MHRFARYCGILLALLVLAMGAAMAEDGLDEQDPPTPDLYSGNWVCDRATMEIDWEQVGYKVLIEWGSSAWEQSRWEYSCYYDENSRTMTSLPFGLRTDFVYDEAGEVVSATEVYDDGEATFSLDGEGYVLWADAKENAGEGLRFERLPDEAAEEAAAAEPLFATLGDAMADPGYTDITGGDDSHYVVVVAREGAAPVRAVADLDEETLRLRDEMFEAEDYDAAREVLLAKLKSLPVSYTEELTAVPKEQAELDALAGKRIADLEAEGYVYGGSGFAGDQDPVFTMEYGFYLYDCVVNGTGDEYSERQDNDTLGEMTVKSASYVGLSGNAANLDYQADGTYTAPEDDGWGEFGEVMQIISDAVTAAGDGELDVDAVVAQLMEHNPDADPEELRTFIALFAQMAAAAQTEAAGTPDAATEAAPEEAPAAD